MLVFVQKVSERSFILSFLAARGAARNLFSNFARDFSSLLPRFAQDEAHRNDNIELGILVFASRSAPLGSALLFIGGRLFLR